VLAVRFKPCIPAWALKGELGMVCDSSTTTHARTHTRTRTHPRTHGGARTPAPGELEFAKPEGSLALGNRNPAPGGVESTQDPPGGPGESPSADLGQPERPPGHICAFPGSATPAPARPPRQLPQVSTSRWASLSRMPHHERPLPAPGLPSRPTGLQARDRRSAGVIPRGRPRRPHSGGGRRCRAAAAGASPRLPGSLYVLFTPVATALSGEATALSGEPTPERRALQLATTSLVMCFLETWGDAGAVGHIFRLFCFRALALFFFFFRELAGARCALGPGGSAPAPASAAGSPASGRGWRAGSRERRRGSPASRAEPSSFPRHRHPAGPDPLPLPRALHGTRESPAAWTAHRVAAFHIAPPSRLWPQLSPAQTHTHTHAPHTPHTQHTHTPPLPRPQLHFPG
jgi:hypothetical protein